MKTAPRMPLFIGIDVGTSGATALVTDSEGRILGETSASYGVLSPRPLWAEQWPSVWLDGLSEAVRNLLDQVSIDAKAVAAITISSLYGGSGIPVDTDLRPIRPCIIWLDRRASRESEWVSNSVDVERLTAITGNGVDSYYGFTKMLWLKNNEPDEWEHIRYFLPPNAYLIYRLTGEVAIDHSSAGNIGGVYDINKRAWSDESCEMLGLPRRVLPDRLVASTDIVGHLDEAGAELTGLIEGTPVCAGGVDAAAATLSAGVFEQGRHVAMMGTSMCWGFVHEQRPEDSGLVSMPYVIDPERLIYTFGGAATAGAVPAWFRDEFAGVGHAIDIEEPDLNSRDGFAGLDQGASAVSAGSDGVFVLPYFMGERGPIWDANARGTITGLTLFHTRSHIYRACLEGVAYALRHNIESGLAAGYQLDDTLHVVGGATQSALWTQILSDVTGRRVLATKGGEAAFGDAMIAAIGSGHASIESVMQWTEGRQAEGSIEPNTTTSTTYDTIYPHYLSLYENLREWFQSTAALSQNTTPDGDSPA